MVLLDQTMVKKRFNLRLEKTPRVIDKLSGFVHRGARSVVENGLREVDDAPDWDELLMLD